MAMIEALGGVAPAAVAAALLLGAASTVIRSVAWAVREAGPELRKWGDRRSRRRKDV